jgi:chromosome segregation ATPase
MATSKEIGLTIKGIDLASKPLQNIGAAVDRLVSAVNDIVPASEKGEKNLSELTSTAGQLGKALTGLQADKAIIESFEALSVKVQAASEKLKLLQAEADSAKVAISNSAAPTKAMTNAADKAASAATRQATALGKLTTQLENLKSKAGEASARGSRPTISERGCTISQVASVSSAPSSSGHSKYCSRRSAISHR